MYTKSTFKKILMASMVIASPLAAAMVSVEPVLHFTDQNGSTPTGTLSTLPILNTKNNTMYGISYSYESYGSVFRFDPYADNVYNSYQYSNIESDYVSVPGNMQSNLIEVDGDIYAWQNNTSGGAKGFGQLIKITDAEGKAAFVMQGNPIDVDGVVTGQATNVADVFIFNGIGQFAADSDGNIYYFATAMDSGNFYTGAVLVKRDKENNFTVVRDFRVGKNPVVFEEDEGGIRDVNGAAIIYSEKDSALYATVNRVMVTGNATKSMLLKINISDVTNNGNTPVEKLAQFTKKTRQSINDMSTLVEVGGWIYGNADDLYVASAEAWLWRIKKDGTGFAVVHQFYKQNDGTAASGAALYGPMVLASDGNLYGTTLYGGLDLNPANTSKLNGDGTLYRIVIGTAEDRSDDTFEHLHKFSAAAEGRKVLGLTAGKPGELYGAAQEGGTYNKGAVFRVTYPLPAAEVVAFTATPDTLEIGSGTITLSWEVKNVFDAQTCSLVTDATSEYTQWNGHAISENGSLQLPAPQRAGTEIFTLRCNESTLADTVVKTAPIPPVVKNNKGGGGAMSHPLLLVLSLGLLALRRRLLQV